MNNYSRKEERIKVIQCLYQIFVNIENNNENYDATKIICDIYDVKEFSSVPEFSQLIYVACLDNLTDIIKAIEPNLRNWIFSRLDNVAKAILVLGVGEGNYTKLNNKKIIINVLVDISKEFLKDQDYKFINAVLDKTIK